MPQLNRIQDFFSRRKTLRGLPSSIWALGFGSLFMDTSSELVHSLLPVFMTSVLGAGMVTIGLIEGIAEATASITKVYSGALSDYLGKRKGLLVLGYALSACTKLMFPLAPSIGWVLGARFADRVGKGIRGAPRDALVADITPPRLQGTAYGLRQALDSIGAFIGPLLAVILMGLFANHIRTVLWWSVVPAFVAVALLSFFVCETSDKRRRTNPSTLICWANVRGLTPNYWFVVVLGAIFSLARFSEAFLLLLAQSVGLAMVYVPVVLMIMNLVYAVAAYPAGLAADRFSCRTLLLAGLGALILADFVLASATCAQQVLSGAALWGLHMGLTQSLLSKLVAESAPIEFRGTAFGIFNMVSGVALLLASVVAGILWDRIGPHVTFLTGAGFAALAAISIMGHSFRFGEDKGSFNSS